VKRTVLPILVLGCLLAGPAGALTLAPVDSLPLPAGRTTGLCWVGGDTVAVLTAVPDSMATVDRELTFLVVQDTTGAVLWQEDFTGTLARGLTYDGEFFWSCGDEQGGGSLLYKIAADTVRVEQAHPTLGHRPVALAADGRWLWLSDRDRARLDRIDPETGDATRSVSPPGFSPYGVAYDGQALWVTDSATGRLYRLRGARGERVTAVEPESFLHRGEDVLLMHDGRRLWVVLPGATHAVGYEVR